MAQPTITPNEAVEIIQSYQGRESAFIHEVLGAGLWDLQKQITDAVFKYPVVAVRSCNASGKTYVSARIALTFLTTKPGSIVITTAPTWRQVKDVFWREFRTAYNMSMFKLSKEDCNTVGLDYAEDWFAVGLSTKDSEKFFGYHADDILVIVDEASGVEEEIYIGVDAVTPNINAHVLMIGNPTNPDGRFFKAFNDPMVKKFRISAFDTPNLTANGITDLQTLLRIFTPPPDVEPIEHVMNVQKQLVTPYPALISPSRVYQRYLQWGEESPMWDALIMGEFPKQASMALIPLNLILKSVEVWKQINASKRDSELKIHPEWQIAFGDYPEYGLDVARFGSDTTVLFERNGGYVKRPSVWAKLDTSVTTDRVISEINPFDPVLIKPDDTGLGGGVTDQLRRKKQEHPEYQFTVAPINFAEGTTNPRKYFNLRAEMYDHLAEQFKQHKIAIPDDDDLIMELASIRVDYVGKESNILKVESKDKIRERLHKSPDKADALVLAFYSKKIGMWTSPDDKLESERGYESRIAPITSDLIERY
jgi:hypothetical protein